MSELIENEDKNMSVLSKKDTETSLGNLLESIQSEISDLSDKGLEGTLMHEYRSKIIGDEKTIRSALSWLLTGDIAALTPSGDGELVEDIKAHFNSMAISHVAESNESNSAFLTKAEALLERCLSALQSKAPDREIKINR